MLNQGVLKDLSQVDLGLVLCHGELCEIAQQRNVVSVYAVVHSVHPLQNLGDFAIVELAHDEEFTVLTLGRFLCDADPFSGEHPADVRHSIQSEAVHTHFIHHPLSPSLHILSDFGVGVVDVSEHEIVAVAFEIIDVGGPVLLAPGWIHSGSRTGKCLWRVHDLVDSILLSALVPVCAAEVLPVPFQTAIVVSATREVEVDPGFDLLWCSPLDSTVCLEFSQSDGSANRDMNRRTFSVYLDSPALLFGVSSCFVVQNSIPDDQDSQALGLCDQLVQLFSRSPLGCACPLLVELAQIPEVIAIIAVAVRVVGLAARRKPE